MADAGTKPRVATPLPPPPAPTSRDANPWPMPSAALRAARNRRWHVNPIQVARPKDPLGRRTLPDPVSSAAGGRQGATLRWVPVVVLAIVIIAAARGAREALRSGDLVGALIPIVAVAVVASGFVRALRKDKR